MTENINRRIDDAVEAYRIDSYGIDDLGQIMKDVKSDVRLRSYTIGDDGKESISESGVFMIVSMILGMIIYMFIVLFGGMVMSSVIEEKSSRVVEVLISSVKATELMFGKIIGIALVALTQFILWIVLTAAIVGIVGAVAGPSLFGDAASATEMIQTMGGGDAAAQAIAAASEPGEMQVIMSSIASMPLVKILVCFLIFFLFGYVLYASLFAAIGSAVENEGDSQQLQLPVTIPLLLGFFIAFYAFKAPDSALVFWGSIIPFTSPIVMLARLPFDVPAWQLILSIVLLILTCIACAWASAKIYKVGILMFGKKSTWKDLWKWLKQK
jgi:ABC-2 type transport system permease protein